MQCTSIQRVIYIYVQFNFLAEVYIKQIDSSKELVIEMGRIIYEIMSASLWVQRHNLHIASLGNMAGI